MTIDRYSVCEAPEGEGLTLYDHVERRRVYAPTWNRVWRSPVEAETVCAEMNARAAVSFNED